jgi:hypothetical protein
VMAYERAKAARTRISKDPGGHGNRVCARAGAHASRLEIQDFRFQSSGVQGPMLRDCRFKISDFRVRACRGPCFAIADLRLQICACRGPCFAIADLRLQISAFARAGAHASRLQI